jgi:pyruvate,water dikinase
MLSHGAIIAREFGIPAVVGVYKATELIRDGQEITVNGNTGKIELHD